MTKAKLTQTEGYALTDNHTAVRQSYDILITRTAMYEWSDEQACWERTTSGLKVEHVSRAGQPGWKWDKPTKAFVACDCTTCFLRHNLRQR